MLSKLLVVGASGRMGKRILFLSVDACQFEIIACIEALGHPDIGKDAGVLCGQESLGVRIGTEFTAGADVVIDFSQPSGADATVDYCLENNSALVMGTTGLSDKQHGRIAEASKKIAIIYGTNMSVGMNVLFNLAGKAANLLGQDYDIEIVEQHHRFKKDSPSGSALSLAKSICESTGMEYPGSLVHGREGKESLRKKGEIGIHAVRAGDIAGKHSVILSTLGETVTLEHEAHGRDSFAKGALRAANWLIGKEAGLYTMAECLGIK